MWGERTRDWGAGSSPADFLASRTINRLCSCFTPARVARVFAIAQSEVLGYTPDLYDVFLFIDNGPTGQICNCRHPRFNTQAG